MCCISFVLIMLLGIKSKCNPKQKSVEIYLHSQLRMKMEYAYFEGMKDAINGDIRIAKNDSGCWSWTKSCWDDGSEMVFNPNSICDSVSNASDMSHDDHGSFKLKYNNQEHKMK